MEAIIRVFRRWFFDDCTLGDMTFGEHGLKTLEDKVRATGIKVWGKTAIPAGRYEMGIYNSPKFKREVPILKEVDDFTFIEIHSLNTADQTDGCIGVGTRMDLKDHSIHGGTTEGGEKLITDWVKDNLAEGRRVFIEIAEDPIVDERSEDK